MRILMLGWELHPFNSGGLGVVCKQLCQALAKEGVDIEFVLPYTADHKVDFMTITPVHEQTPEQLLKSANVYASASYQVMPGGGGASIYEQVKMYEEAASRMAFRKQYDVIHAHDWLTFRAGLRVKERLGCPLVMHLHTIERDRAGGERGNPLCREIEETSLQLADQVIAVSQFTKDAIIDEYGIPEDKITVVHNCVDHELLQQIEGKPSYPYLEAMHAHGYRIVVVVGRLTVQKGFANLLYAMKEVVDRAPKTLLLVVGDGEQYVELLELAAELGISKNVIFTGFLRGKQWRDAFSVGDLFALPSVSEPFGITALEAIAYGTPVLLSKQSGVAEVIRNALTIDHWDVKEMANKITALVQNDSLRDTLHQNAWDEYIKLSWRDSAVKLHNLYKRYGAQRAKVAA